MADRTPITASHSGNPPDVAQRPDLREQAQELGAQVQECVQEIGTQVHNWTQEARQRVEASVSQLSEQGHEAVGQLEKALADYIRARPLQSLLIAAGMGMLVGLLWRK